MSILSSWMWSGLNRSRLPAMSAPIYGGIGSILMFHRVADEPHAGFAAHANIVVAPAFFEAVLRRLRDLGYDLVTLDEARLHMAEPSVERRFACITFDDGFRDNFEVALPICRRYGAPITVFLATGFIDRIARDLSFGAARLVAAVREVAVSFGGRDIRLPAATLSEKLVAYGRLKRLLKELGPDASGLCERLAGRYGIDVRAVSEGMFLTWDMAAEMQRSGLVSFGAHSIRHVPLSSLSVDELVAEMCGSRDRIQARLGRPVAHFAYPFGGAEHAGWREFRQARELGFATAVTTRHGNVMPEHRDALHSLPRLSVNGRHQTLAALDVFLSGATAALANRFRRVVTV